MSIRTVGQLDSFLSRSLGWRKKELTALKFVVDTAPDDERKVLLRAATTLLYAHWEGFVKDAGTAYLEFVARQGLNLNQLATNFVAVTMVPMIQATGQSRKPSTYKKIIDRLTTDSAKPAKMGWKGVVKTRSNLKSDVLKDIVATLALDFSPFETKAKPVIDKLVGARNGVAHGEGIRVEYDDYIALHSDVIVLLDEFKTQLQDAASTGRYKK